MIDQDTGIEMNNQKRRIAVRRLAEEQNSYSTDSAPHFRKRPAPYKMSRPQKQVKNNPELADRVAKIRERHQDKRRKRREDWKFGRKAAANV